jgi:hypothetical protein
MGKRKLLLASLMFVLAIGLVHAWQDGEVLYLSDSHRGVHRDDDHTHLFRVFLDTAATPPRADLVPLPNGAIPLNDVDAIAVSLDGEKLFAMDVFTGEFGYYHIPTAGWVDLGHVTEGGNPVLGIVQAAFTPDGRFIVVSSTAELAYELNPANGNAAILGPFQNADTGGFLNIAGGDIAFLADGTGILWTNFPGIDAPRGMYSFSLPNAPGFIQAIHIGDVQGDYFTGIAIRANGYGDMIASGSLPEPYVHTHDTVTGADTGTSPYMMYIDGVHYTDYASGDMANGPLGYFCTRTIGYHMNHDWPISVSICGVAIGQEEGQEILSSAKGKNFSMLIAQLIAAKLNTGNALGVDIIDGAETFLCEQGVVNEEGELWWNMPFESKQQKAEANYWKDMLDAFNNENQCEDSDRGGDKPFKEESDRTKPGELVREALKDIDITLLF